MPKRKRAVSQDTAIDINADTAQLNETSYTSKRTRRARATDQIISLQDNAAIIPQDIGSSQSTHNEHSSGNGLDIAMVGRPARRRQAVPVDMSNVSATHPQPKRGDSNTARRAIPADTHNTTKQSSIRDDGSLCVGVSVECGICLESAAQANAHTSTTTSSHSHSTTLLVGSWCTLPCAHAFHHTCLAQWIRTREVAALPLDCPRCRREVPFSFASQHFRSSDIVPDKPVYHYWLAFLNGGGGEARGVVWAALGGCLVGGAALGFLAAILWRFLLAQAYSEQAIRDVYLYGQGVGLSMWDFFAQRPAPANPRPFHALLLYFVAAYSVAILVTCRIIHWQSRGLDCSLLESLALVGRCLFFGFVAPAAVLFATRTRLYRSVQLVLVYMLGTVCYWQYFLVLFKMKLSEGDFTGYDGPILVIASFTCAVSVFLGQSILMRLIR